MPMLSSAQVGMPDLRPFWPSILQVPTLRPIEQSRESFNFCLVSSVVASTSFAFFSANSARDNINDISPRAHSLEQATSRSRARRSCSYYNASIWELAAASCSCSRNTCFFKVWTLVWFVAPRSCPSYSRSIIRTLTRPYS